EHARALHPGRSCSDDEDVELGRARRRIALRVPTAAVLLAHRRVLHAAEPDGAGLHRDAEVRARALANVAVATLLDLPRQERVGGRRPRRAPPGPDARAA